MREIKFRQWDSIRNKYQYDIGITGPGSWAGPSYCTWEKYPLEQFTGLLDKNWKAIYENDVVRLSENVYGLYYGPGQIVVIEWDEDSTGFKPFMDENSDYDGVSGSLCEIIGTIHDAEYKELAK